MKKIELFLIAFILNFSNLLAQNLDFKVLDLRPSASSVDISFDNKFLATIGTDLKIYKIINSNVYLYKITPIPPNCCLKFFPNKNFISVALNRRVLVYKIEDNKIEIFSQSPPSSKLITALDVSVNDLIAVAYLNRQINIFKLKKQKLQLLQTIQTSLPVKKLKISKNGKFLAALSDSLLNIYSIENDTLIQINSLNINNLIDFSITNNGNLLLLEKNNEEFAIFSRKIKKNEYQKAKKFFATTEEVKKIALSQDNKLLYVLEKNYVLTFKLKKYSKISKHIATIPTFIEAENLTVSADNNFLLAYNFQQIFIFEKKEKQFSLLKSLNFLKSNITNFAVSEYGNLFATTNSLSFDGKGSLSLYAIVNSHFIKKDELSENFYLDAPLLFFNDSLLLNGKYVFNVASYKLKKIKTLEINNCSQALYIKENQILVCQDKNQLYFFDKNLNLISTKTFEKNIKFLENKGDILAILFENKSLQLFKIQQTDLKKFSNFEQIDNFKLINQNKLITNQDTILSFYWIADEQIKKINEKALKEKPYKICISDNENYLIIQNRRGLAVFMKNYENYKLMRYLYERMPNAMLFNMKFLKNETILITSAADGFIIYLFN